MTGDSSAARFTVAAPRTAPDPWRDLAERPVTVGGRELRLVHPRDSEALLDEEAFEREEFLPYWAQLWPSGIALARAVAALAGARVLATDWSADAVAFTAANASRNGASLRTAACSWTEPAPMLAQAPWDLVLAADVLYEARNGPQLLELLPRLVDEAGEVWIADPGRRPAERFLTATATPVSGWLRRSTQDRWFPQITLHRLRRRPGPAR